MDSDHGEQAWVDANAARVSDVLGSPDVQQALYRLLGGEPDPERRKEALAREVARLRGCSGGLDLALPVLHVRRHSNPRL